MIISSKRVLHVCGTGFFFWGGVNCLCPSALWGRERGETPLEGLLTTRREERRFDMVKVKSQEMFLRTASGDMNNPR